MKRQIYLSEKVDQQIEETRKKLGLGRSEFLGHCFFFFKLSLDQEEKNEQMIRQEISLKVLPSPFKTSCCQHFKGCEKK